MLLRAGARALFCCVLAWPACSDRSPAGEMDDPHEQDSSPATAGGSSGEPMLGPSDAGQRDGATGSTAGSMGMDPSSDAGSGAGSAAGAGSGSMDDGGAFTGNARSDIEFDWKRTKPDALPCQPGHYEGSFAGVYYSHVDWPEPFPVTGIDLPNMPGLQLDVKPPRPGAMVMEVEGQFAALADGVFPFRGSIAGQLDCASGKFSGKMVDADYSFGPRDPGASQSPMWFSFEGPVSADYDKLTHTFVNGQWDATEPALGGTPAPELPRDPERDGVGGSGVWSSGWSAPPREYHCPELTGDGLPLLCEPGALGLDHAYCVTPSLLIGFRSDAPPCMTAAECELHFPGVHAKCVDVNGDGAFVRCLQECTP